MHNAYAQLLFLPFLFSSHLKTNIHALNGSPPSHRVNAARAHNSEYTYDVSPEHAVIHTATRDAYCSVVRLGSSESTPSVNGYFAYVLDQAGGEEESM